VRLCTDIGLADPNVFFAIPSGGLTTGGYKVTIIGTDLNNGIDVVYVKLAGVLATSISYVSPTKIVVTAGARDNDWTDSIEIQSASMGGSAKLDGFSYFSTSDPDCPLTGGDLTAIIPDNGPKVGNNVITISGSFFSNGSDVYQVVVGGRMATLLSQSSTTVVARLPANLASGSQDVAVLSTCFGASIQADGYLVNTGANSPVPSPRVARSDMLMYSSFHFVLLSRGWPYFWLYTSHDRWREPGRRQ
jgi:hypothetical protein